MATKLIYPAAHPQLQSCRRKLPAADEEQREEDKDLVEHDRVLRASCFGERGRGMKAAGVQEAPSWGDDVAERVCVRVTRAFNAC